MARSEARLLPPLYNLFNVYIHALFLIRRIVIKFALNTYTVYTSEHPYMSIRAHAPLYRGMYI